MSRNPSTTSATGPSTDPTPVIWRVTGLSCADCAAQFERDVLRHPEVEGGALNFGAAKLTVTGSLDEHALRRIASSHGLGLERDGVRGTVGTPSQEGRTLLFACLALVGAWVAPLLSVPIWSSGFFFGTAIVLGGGKTFQLGLRGIAQRRLDINVLMLVAVTGAVLIGEWNEATVISILFGVSHLLESRSLDRVRASIRGLTEMAPEVAVVKNGQGEHITPVEDVRIGSIVIVRPGDRFPVDGQVILGESSVNQAAITGESIPVHIGVGSQVFAGTVNEHGYVEVRVTKEADETALTRIVHLVEEAQAGRAPAQRFVDRFAAVYTPVIVLLALATALLPPLFFDGLWWTWTYRALALLVVACPCALVVSTPVTLLSAIGAGARQGVLIKGGAYLEAMAKVKAIAFDKTGTLTQGSPEVSDVVTAPGIDETAMLTVVASIEQRSGHPLASAILQHAKGKGVEPHDVDDFSSHLGLGVSAAVRGVGHYVGNRRFLHNTGVDTSGLDETWSALEQQGKTVVGVADERGLLGLLGVSDVIRTETPEVTEELRQLGIEHLVMLTGDNERTARGIAGQAGLTAFEAEMLPDQKALAVQTLVTQFGSVAMIGDGVNDAPALAASTVGVAMGGIGSDTALETADIVLMSDNLSLIPFAVRLSRKAIRIVQQNITFSLALKAVSVALVFFGWLTLWMAIVGDMGATLLVTLNGARLLAEGRTHKHKLPFHKGKASRTAK